MTCAEFANRSQKTIDHLIPAHPTLEKHEDLERYNKICKYPQWNTCREYEMDELPKKNLPRTVPANKPDIILRHNFEKWCKLIVKYPYRREKTPDSQRRGQKEWMWGERKQKLFRSLWEHWGGYAIFYKRKPEENFEEFKRIK